MPKEMLPIVDRPLIQYAVEEAAAAGIEEFIFVTGRGKHAIEDHFDDSFELNQLLSDQGKDDVLADIQRWMPKPGQVSYTRQMAPLGLGHAVWCARHLIGDEPFAVLLADDLVMSKTPCLKQMVDVHGETGGQPGHTSRRTDLAKMAEGGCIPNVRTVTKEAELAEAAQMLSEGNGTSFVLVKVAPTKAASIYRSRDASWHKGKFREALLGTN